MDILGTLVGGQGCATDGTTSARNPLSRLVDTLMEGSAGSQQKAPARRAPIQGRAMRLPPTSRAGGELAAAAASQVGQMPTGPHVGGMPSGPMSHMGAAGPAGPWMGPPPVLPGHPGQAVAQV